MYALKLANSPCSWGVLEFDLESESAAGEPAACDDVLREMKAAGYGATELGEPGFLPDEPLALAKKLNEFGMALVGGFVPIRLVRRDRHAFGIGRALDTARLMAAVAPDAYLIVADDNGTDPARVASAGRIEPHQSLDDRGFATVVDGVHDVAQAVLRETGLRTVFHHHCAGFVETPDEIERLMARTDPSLVGLCFDVGHYAFGGGDPVDGLLRFRNRIEHIHFKDVSMEVVAQSRGEGWDYFQSIAAGVFCELGAGYVDFEGLLRELHGQQYRGWVVVEQDVLPGCGTPFASAVRNRRYLYSVGVP